MVYVSCLQTLSIFCKDVIIKFLDSPLKHVERPSDSSAFLNTIEKVMVFIDRTLALPIGFTSCLTSLSLLNIFHFVF